MRKVDKDHDNPPEILNSDECREEIQNLLKKNSERHFSDHYKKPPVKEKLNELYHGKCAYCESKLKRTVAPQIDHYRPKKKVKKVPLHPGYYWLAHHWSNLIPSCGICNRSKGTSFPLESESKRVTAPPITADGELIEKQCQAKLTPLIDENPLLLHPEIDDPGEHLIFLPNGELEGKTKQGDKTIEICQLNREELALPRKKIFRKFINQFSNLIFILPLLKKPEKPEEEELIKEAFYRIFREICNEMHPSQEYSMVGLFIFEKFDSFFLEHLTTLIPDEEVINQVKKAYESFKRNPREYPTCSEYHADVE